MSQQDMSLAVRIRGDASGLRNEMQRTGTQIRGIMTNIAGAFGAGFSAAAIVRSVRGVMDYAASLRDAAVQAETTTTKLQALREAALRASGDDRQLDVALQRLNASRAQAIEGNEQMRRSFERLGIDRVQLEVLDGADLLEVLGRRLVNADSRSAEFSSALDVLGRRAGALVPMLRQLGEEGIGSLVDSLREEGRLFTEEMENIFDAAEKGWQRLGQRFKVSIGELGMVGETIKESIRGLWEGTGIREMSDEAQYVFRLMDAMEEIRRESPIRARLSPFWARREAWERVHAEDAAEKKDAEEAAKEQATREARERNIATLRQEAAEIEAAIAESRLSDAEMLEVIEERIAQLRRESGEESDELAQAALDKAIAQAEAQAEPLRRREADRQERESDQRRREEESAQERAERMAERAAEQRRREQQEYRDIREGRGVGVSAPTAADQLAAIGGFVGAQQDVQRTLAERQIQIQERMAQFLERIAERGMAEPYGVVP